MPNQGVERQVHGDATYTTRAKGTRRNRGHPIHGLLRCIGGALVAFLLSSRASPITAHTDPLLLPPFPPQPKAFCPPPLFYPAPHLHPHDKTTSLGFCAAAADDEKAAMAAPQKRHASPFGLFAQRSSPFPPYPGFPPGKFPSPFRKQRVPVNMFGVVRVQVGGWMGPAAYLSICLPPGAARLCPPTYPTPTHLLGWARGTCSEATLHLRRASAREQVVLASGAAQTNPFPSS